LNLTKLLDADYKNSALATPGSDTDPHSNNFTNTYGSWDSHDSVPNGNLDDSSISPLFKHPALGSQIPPANEDEDLVSNLAGVGSEVRLEQDPQIVAYDGSNLDGLKTFQLATEGQFDLPSAVTNSLTRDAPLSCRTPSRTPFSLTDWLVDGWNEEVGNCTAGDNAIL
jgi:hypothetical protein